MKIYKNPRRNLTTLKNFNNSENTFRNKYKLGKSKDKGFKSKRHQQSGNLEIKSKRCFTLLNFPFFTLQLFKGLRLLVTQLTKLLTQKTTLTTKTK